MPTSSFKNAADYHPDLSQHVRQACLYLATKLGDLLDDLILVGGTVPSLLVPQEGAGDGMQPHVGTRDLDLGLKVALLEDKRYEELTDRLREAGMEPGFNERGNRTSQTWRFPNDPEITVDFLIGPSGGEDEGGKLRNIQADFAAIITPALPLAFQDRENVELTGTTRSGETAGRTIQVCGPGAFVVLKALALRGRGRNKDAYDLHYVASNFGAGIEDVAKRLRPLMTHDSAQEALAILEADFCEADRIGPQRVAEFLGDTDNQDLVADVAGDIRRLVRLV